MHSGQKMVQEASRAIWPMTNPAAPLLVPGSYVMRTPSYRVAGHSDSLSYYRFPCKLENLCDSLLVCHARKQFLLASD